MLSAALTGFVMAFVASMPVAGPVAALIVRHGLEGHVKSAILLGVGSGIAEGIYAFLALWGFSTFLADYPIVVPISKAVAAVILIALGVWFTRFVPQGMAAARVSQQVGEMLDSERERPLRCFSVGLSVTVLNPTLLATWAAATTTIMSMELFEVTPASAAPFGFGVVLGACAWFTLLVWLLARLRHRFSPRMLQRTIRVMGWGLVALGVWFAVSFAQAAAAL